MRALREPGRRPRGPSGGLEVRLPGRQAASALVMVGQGVSYTEAADRLRARNRRDRFAGGAQLVANWVEVLAPVVAARHAEAAWPETVVLDSTWFMVTNTTMGTTTRAFSVLGAYGYEAGGLHGPGVGAEGLTTAALQ